MSECITYLSAVHFKNFKYGGTDIFLKEMCPFKAL